MNEQIKAIKEVLDKEQILMANNSEEYKKLLTKGVTYCHAEAIYGAGYRKVPDGAVVLTKEDYETLSKSVRCKIGNMKTTEFLRVLIASGFIIKVESEDEKIMTARKEAVKDFAEKLKQKIGDIGVYAFTKEDIVKLLKEYDNG